MTIFKELRTYECCYEGLLVNKKYCSYGRVRKSLEEKKYRSFDYVLVLQHFCKTFLNKKPTIEKKLASVSNQKLSEHEKPYPFLHNIFAYPYLIFKYSQNIFENIFENNMCPRQCVQYVSYVQQKKYQLISGFETRIHHTFPSQCFLFTRHVATSTTLPCYYIDVISNATLT